MAQTGYTPILLYSSSTVSQAPAAGNLTNSTLGSELAINITDGKLFYKDNLGAVQVIGWKTVPTTAGGTGLTSYTAGDLLYYATGTTLTKLAIGANKTILTSSGTAPQWSASLDTTQGGTGLTSYTAGDLIYYASGTAFTKLAIGTANTVLTSSGTAPQWSTGLNNVTIGATTATTGKFTTIQASTNIGVGTATSVQGIFNVGGGRSFFGANSETYSIGLGYTQARVNSGQTFYIGATDATTPALVFSNAAGTERFRVADNGDLTSLSTYSATVGGTNRDLFVDNTGLLGYVTSIRASKTNILSISDTDWLYKLKPVSFNYRKKDTDGNYTEEVDGPIEYGLIAEDTETVKPELCFYDEINGKKVLRGISYSKLVTPMLQAIQELRREFEEYKNSHP